MVWLKYSAMRILRCGLVTMSNVWNVIWLHYNLSTSMCGWTICSFLQRASVCVCSGIRCNRNPMFIYSHILLCALQIALKVLHSSFANVDIQPIRKPAEHIRNDFQFCICLTMVNDWLIGFTLAVPIFSQEKTTNIHLHSVLRINFTAEIEYFIRATCFRIRKSVHRLSIHAHFHRS